MNGDERSLANARLCPDGRAIGDERLRKSPGRRRRVAQFGRRVRPSRIATVAWSAKWSQSGFVVVNARAGRPSVGQELRNPR
jgi:hypothetical protein